MKERALGVKVGDIMTRNFISAKPEISVLGAAKLMTKKRVGSLILEENGYLKGILTEKDIIWALTKKPERGELAKVRAKDICAKKLTTIKPSADVQTAIKLMRKKKFRRLPVTLKKKVIGYLTLKDILRIQPELFKIAQESYIIKEQSAKLKRKQVSESFREGLCEECGNQDILYKQDGRLMCESCLDNM